MTNSEIFKGNALAPGERVVWQGRPSIRTIVRDVFHLRIMSAYIAGLFGLDAYQAWVKQIPVAKALHDSVPLVLVVALASAIFIAIAVLIARTTTYTITDRRVILKYGMAMTATLSLPFARIVGASVAVGRDHSGDIALTLASGDRMPWLKLWPHARPWRLAQPQPMLRGVPRAAIVGAQLTRALQASAQSRKLVVGELAVGKLVVGAPVVGKPVVGKPAGAEADRVPDLVPALLLSA